MARGLLLALLLVACSSAAEPPAASDGAGISPAPDVGGYVNGECHATATKDAFGVFTTSGRFGVEVSTGRFQRSTEPFRVVWHAGALGTTLAIAAERLGPDASPRWVYWDVEPVAQKTHWGDVLYLTDIKSIAQSGGCWRLRPRDEPSESGVVVVLWPGP